MWDSPNLETRPIITCLCLYFYSMRRFLPPCFVSSFRWHFFLVWCITDITFYVKNSMPDRFSQRKKNSFFFVWHGPWSLTECHMEMRKKYWLVEHIIKGLINILFICTYRHCWNEIRTWRLLNRNRRPSPTWWPRSRPSSTDWSSPPATSTPAWVSTILGKTHVFCTKNGVPFYDFLAGPEMSCLHYVLQGDIEDVWK